MNKMVWNLVGGRITLELENGRLSVRGSGVLNLELFWRRHQKEARQVRDVIVWNGVREIGDYSFAELPELRRVVLAQSVRWVDACAFYGNPVLESVEFKGSSIDEIGCAAFRNCRMLRNLRGITYCRSAAYNAFENTLWEYEQLQTHKVTAFGGVAMRAKPMVTAVCAFDFPQGVHTVANYAFADQPLLDFVEFPKSIEAIGKSLFVNGSGNVEVKLPEKRQSLLRNIASMQATREVVGIS